MSVLCIGTRADSDSDSDLICYKIRLPNGSLVDVSDVLSVRIA